MQMSGNSVSEHEQTWVKVNAPVDRGIAEVVRLLSTIPSLETLDSCEGRPGGKAHVIFRYGGWRQLGEFLFDDLAPLLSDDKDHCMVTLELNDMLTGALYFSPELMPRVVSALQQLPPIASGVSVTRDT